MTQEEGREIDLKGLALLDSHRWLRPMELAMFLYPAQLERIKSAERKLRQWRAADWIIERRLPRRAGRAIVLSEAGAREIGAVSGKDWGDHAIDKFTGTSTWAPPQNWKHDLYQSSLLACLSMRGYEIVLTERDVRRQSARKDRHLPDAVVRKGDIWWWVEVESERKSGALQRQMVRALIQAATESETWVCATCTVNAAMLVFSSTQRDERSYRLSHHSRTVAAIRRQADRDVPITLAVIHTDATGAAINVTTTSDTVVSDAAARTLDKIDWVQDGDGVCHGNWKNGICFRYWRNAEPGAPPWGWEASVESYGQGGAPHTSRKLDEGVARTAEEAKIAAYEAAIRNLTLKELGD